MLIVERLDPERHQRDLFSCGEPSLDRYLKQQAMQHHRAGISTTHVLLSVEQPDVILGYYSLSAAQLLLTDLQMPDLNGIDLIRHAQVLSPDTVVVNVQGDEPLIPADLINEVARVLTERPDASMSTAAHAIGSLEEFTNPNVVKVVMDARQMALYFSRAPIPWWRDGQLDSGFKALPSPAPLRHIGIYGYRAGFLALFPTLPPAPVETMESLEQLRALWHGHRIAVHVTAASPGPGVDTPEDLDRVRQLLLT